MERTLLPITLLWLLVVGPLHADPLEIKQLDVPVELDGAWKFQTGDDMAWADPALDDAQWDELRVPLDWGRQDYDGYTSLAWYRRTLTFDLTQPAVSAHINTLSLTMGKVHSAYELFIDGRPMGGVGKLPPDPVIIYDKVRSYQIPADLIADGEIVIAVRVWRSEELDHSSSERHAT